MKKNRHIAIALSIIALSTGSGLAAQTQYGTIETIYQNMPSDINPFLSPQKRLELMEYHKATQGDSIKNVFNNWSEIILLDTAQQLIRVAHTTGTQFEMKLFTNTTDSTLNIGIIESVYAPAGHSTIRFYDERWQLTQHYTLPTFTADDFIDTDSAATNTNIRIDEMRQKLPPLFITAQFAPTGKSITYNNETILTLSAAEQSQYKAYIRSKTVAL